jgi:alpha-beta hydrolase superfamily lysophospholipase
MSEKEPNVPPDYTALDQPHALAVIFHPRPELARPSPSEAMSDHLIPVAAEVQIGARFHTAAPRGATLLFFHGNGEIVADYDELGARYNDQGINFMAVDYRGYGRSNGRPTVSAMMADSHNVFHYAHTWLKQNGFSGPLIVMGRSLGSAPALEVAAAHSDKINGLIIESGFAYAAALLRVLGLEPDRLGFKEKSGFINLDKMAQYKGPTLVIHAEFDHIIPYSDGQALYQASAGRWKHLLKIKGANHNDILMRGLSPYMQAIQELIQESR